MGGRLTPEYAASLVPVRDDLIRWLVERGAPYAGFSAGAAIAATHAVVGGWRHRGRPICPEHAGEDLEEVAVVAGLGLVPFTVEVHADGWETTPRLRAAIADLGEGHVGYALDEDTALIVQGDKLTTIGRGRAARIVGYTQPRQPRPRRVQRRIARVPGYVRDELLTVTYRGSPTT